MNNLYKDGLITGVEMKTKYKDEKYLSRDKITPDIRPRFMSMRGKNNTDHFGHEVCQSRTTLAGTFLAWKKVPFRGPPEKGGGVFNTFIGNHFVPAEASALQCLLLGPARALMVGPYSDSFQLS